MLSAVILLGQGRPCSAPGINGALEELVMGPGWGGVGVWTARTQGGTLLVLREAQGTLKAGDTAQG